MAESETLIRQVLESYKAAVLAKDVNTFVALYDENIRVFDLWGTWSYDGLTAWRAMAVGWFGSLGNERVVVDADQVQVIAAPAMATLSAFVTYTAVSPEGKKLRSLEDRLTWVLQPKAGAWKIVHAHTSSPIDHQTLKVMLHR